MRLKNKTLATWLAFLGGPLGLHRFYLNGLRDGLGWALVLPTLLGGLGVLRLRNLGVNDHWGSVLAPLLGLMMAVCALTAIVYGLMTQEKWNQRFNTDTDTSSAQDHAAGSTSWLTIAAVVLALGVGATALLSALSFAFEVYFSA